MRNLLVWMVGLATVHGLAGAILVVLPRSILTQNTKTVSETLPENPYAIIRVLRNSQFPENRKPLDFDRMLASVQCSGGLWGSHRKQDAQDQHGELAAGDVRVTWASGHGVTGAGRGELPEGMLKPFTDARAGLTRTRSDWSVSRSLYPQAVAAIDQNRPVIHAMPINHAADRASGNIFKRRELSNYLFTMGFRFFRSSHGVNHTALAGLTDRATLPLTGDRGLSQGVFA